MRATAPSLDASVRVIAPSRAMPRLPDCADEAHCSCPPFEALTPEVQVWQITLMWLPVGWIVAPPRFIPTTDEWLIVAYNIRGCLEDYSYARWTHRDRLTAIDCLGVYFEGGTDEACVRAQHRRQE